MKPHYRPTIPKDIEYLAQSLREADREEIAAASGLPPEVALFEGYAGSDACYTMVGAEGVPFGIFGVASVEPGVGSVWMMATNDLPRYSLSFARGARRVVDRWLTEFDALFNIVDARNELHVKWLRWMGFTFIRVHPRLGAGGVPFYEFIKVRPHV